MALESLSNALQSLGAQPYVMNLRSATALTNDPTWSPTTQYFINDMVQSPVNGGMYVYTAWNPNLGGSNQGSCLVSVNDPSSANGAAEGWAPTQSVGLRTVTQTSAAVTGVAAGAAGALGGTAGLALTFTGAGGLGQVSTWLVKIDYTMSITAPPFATDTWAQWTVTPNGTGPTAVSSIHLFGAGATTDGANAASGSPVSMVVNAPADATQFAISARQSATATVLLPGTVTVTYSRLA